MDGLGKKRASLSLSSVLVGGTLISENSPHTSLYPVTRTLFQCFSECVCGCGATRQTGTMNAHRNLLKFPTLLKIQCAELEATRWRSKLR